MSDSKPKAEMGLFVFGQIMTKNHFPGRDGKPDRYGIDVAVPGLRQFVSISLRPEDWGRLNVMEEFKGRISFNVFKGNVYFQPAN